jgi:peptidoglycan/xylan/chitin deacetylase (PgdA/CDA1 family)
VVLQRAERKYNRSVDAGRRLSLRPDVYNDDLPYFVHSEQDKKKKLLLIPYTPDVNDFHYFSNRFANAEVFYTYLKDSFDVMYEESLTNPKMMNVRIHVRISGRAGRSIALQRFLKYVETKEEVWLARRIDICTLVDRPLLSLGDDELLIVRSQKPFEF